MHLTNHKTFERPDQHRRRLLRVLAFGGIAAAVRGSYADELTRTPSQTEGPFFPTHLPLDTDNDLLVIGDASSPADGEVTWLSGAIRDAQGNPVRNALVEIWQCDAHGVYLHPGSGNSDNRDANFQGYGRFVTGLDGSYGFRTIKPVPYPGRTPHIHMKVSRGGEHLLTTQCYVKDHPGNARDGILRSIRDKAQLESILVAFRPLEGSRIGELTARFDVVLGLTPADPDHEPAA